MRLITTTFISLAAFAIISFFIAREYNDPELMNRLGASLAAFGALLVVYQVIGEIRVERKRRADDIGAHDLSPFNAEKAHGLLEKKLAAQQYERLNTVIVISLIIFVGEVMHGWGDVIISSLRFRI